jgi:hypothetical protein
MEERGFKYFSAPKTIFIEEAEVMSNNNNNMRGYTGGGYYLLC